MEKILIEILNELKHHTKLMTYLYEKKDEHQVGSEIIQKQISTVKKMVLSNPAISSNPEMAKMINSIFDITPGGD